MSALDLTLAPESDPTALYRYRDGIFAVDLLTAALVFVWAGLEFTRFAWNRTSELADLPLWLIHVAWPVAAFTWIVFAGEQIVDEARILFGTKR